MPKRICFRAASSPSNGRSWIKRMGRRLIVLSTVVAVNACAPAPKIDIDAEIEARVKRIEAKNGPGQDAHLKHRLIAMAKDDQAVRRPEYVSDTATPEAVREQEQTDRRLTIELKQIVREKGWPTIRMVGLEASGDAGIMLAHSSD